MKCGLKYSYIYRLFRLFGLALLLFFLGSNSGCDFARSWNTQAFEADSSLILMGIDSKYTTGNELKDNIGALKAWQKERGDKEIVLQERQKDASIDTAFVKFGDFGFSLAETLLGGSGLTIIAGLIAWLRKERRYRKDEKREKEIKDNHKREIETAHLVELGKVAYKGRNAPLEAEREMGNLNDKDAIILDKGVV